ncbi:serine/threonine-protein kinase 24-like isoform X3 [Artemia franciscana]|uniref:serine/threonine-protein kinase 24-like isoform X3 n=1 Tax=Artemia franciscana TaxID=6661 RepID=UPI0032DA1693
MEFINGSSAMDLMMRGPVDEFYIRIILREVLKGINYLHSNNLIHRDIKAANILIGGNGEVKIGDLGGIIEATDSQWISGQDTMYGTRLWLSPEQLFNSRYNKKVSTKQIAREKADPLTIYHNFVPLGRGGFGAVFKAQDKFTNETVAIKIVDVEQPHRSSEKIYREVEAFAKLQSPYFPKFYGSYRRDQKLWIIMEFINGSSAMDLMMRGPVDEFYIRIILREVLKGINYFHSNNLIHRDIKAANILIGGNGEVKIGDLGGIIEATDSQWISGQDTMYGTRLWLSPEQLFNSRYNKKVFIDSLE